MNNKASDFLNKEDYIRIFESVMKWPNWKKELANEQLLISKHSVKLPVFTDDANKANCQNVACKKSNI